FIKNREHGVISRANFLQYVQNDLAFFSPVVIRGIDDVQDQISFDNFLQCCAKCGHQLMRKFPNKSDSVGDQNREILPELNPAYEGIQSGKQPARDERVFFGERTKQGRLAGIRVADERNERQPIPPAALPMQLPMLANLLDISFERADPMTDLPAIHFQFGFAGSPRADSAAQTREIFSMAGQSRQPIFQL